MSGAGSGFLYPFLAEDGDARDDGGGTHAPGGDHDVAGLVADLAASVAAKVALSDATRAAARAENRDALHRAAAGAAARLGAGGCLWSFGNGGSATDAAAVADLFLRPPWGCPVPARSLAEEPAVLTALSNDVGVDRVFARQIGAHARPGDVAVGVSTSGDSANVAAGLDAARRRGLLTLGLAGYDGGRCASDGCADHCLVVRSDSVHRIQEAQSALVLDLWERVQAHLPAYPTAPSPGAGP